MTQPIVDPEYIQVIAPGVTKVITVQVPGAQGPGGLPGPGNSISIGTVSTTPAGTNATASLTGASPNQVLNLTVPKGDTGPANVLTVGTVTTGTAGSNAAVTITGTSPNQTINITLPRGDKGDAGATNSLAIGTVTTANAGSSAAASIGGTAPNQTLNLTLPRGSDGATGNTGPANTLAIGTVSTGAPGSSASATITGTAPSQTLNLVIPQGPQGVPGSSAVDATTTSKGSIQLAGDMGGTAAAPTVVNGTNHSHTAAQISNASSVGRSVLTATDGPAARSAIGAGTSSLALGTTSTTAKAGDYQPASTNISDSTTIGRSLIVAASATAAKTAISLGNVDNTSDVNKPVSTAQASAITAAFTTRDNWPYAVMYQTTAQSGLAVGWQTILLQSEIYDNAGGHTDGSTTSRFTVPAGQGGIYAVSGHVTFSTFSSPDLVNNSRILKNGATFLYCTGSNSTVSTTGVSTSSVTGRKIIALAAGDYVELQGYVNATNWATALFSDNACNMTIERIR